MIAAPRPSPFTRLAGCLLRFGGALTGNAPHLFRGEYPWPGCWCDKPEEHPVHVRRSRPRLPRLPLLTGPLLSASTGVALVWMVIAVPIAFARLTALAVTLESLGAVLGLWCIASVMDGHWSGAAALARRRLTDTARLAERSKWTRAERAALKDEVSLEGLLASTGAQARPEGKFR